MNAEPFSLRPPPPGADAVDDLLARTRALKGEHRGARDGWFEALSIEGKDDVLFELEVLLKSAACFANPRNHPGPLRRTPVVAQDFREATQVFRDGLGRSVILARQLLGERDRAFVFHRYLETVLPEDSLRTRLMREGVEQGSPEESLLALRHMLTSTGEVVDGVMRGNRVPYRLFYAVLRGVQREVAHNVYFNPLTALEFRPEFDRIRSTQVLELIRGVRGEEARRLAALTFLALFRMLRYVQLVSRIAQESPVRRRSLSRAWLVLSVLRSDARALSDYLRRRAGARLGGSFEREIFQVPAAEIAARAPALRAAGHRLLGVQAAFEGIAGSLRLELRRAFQHDLPAVDQPVSDAELRAAFLGTAANLQPALRNSILFLGRSLGAQLEAGGVFDDHAAQRETAERLRRDVWMFAHIVRAFAAKAQNTPPDDRWGAAHDFQYVREFLAYFRAMGYPLLRAGDYPRFDAFLAAMDRLADTDLIDPERLERAIDECLAFRGFLDQLFEDISRREVLQGVPFDRRAAGAALRLYLGD